MIITTARKPSSKIRTFCRHLSRFTGWEYVSRGKASLTMLGNGHFLLVGEHKGNPGNLNFFSDGRCVLSIRANVSADNEVGCAGEPVVEGDCALAVAFRKAAGLRVKGSSERVIRVNERIEFIEKGTSYIVLTVLAARGEGVA
jgi:rRNA maturation protein Rpf1